MSEHVQYWIAAYHDGELSGALREEVEAHLATCSDCQAEYTSLRAMSSLLREEPLALLEAVEPAADFTARLNREISRRPGAASAPGAWQPAPAWQTTFRYIPAVLFAGWAFFQAIGVVVAGLLVVAGAFPQAGQMLASLEGLLPANALLPLQLSLAGELAERLLPGQTWLITTGVFALVSLIVLVTLAGLFFSWLAAEWVLIKNKELDNEPYSNTSTSL